MFGRLLLIAVKTSGRPLIIYHPSLMLLWFCNGIDTRYSVKVKKLAIIIFPALLLKPRLYVLITSLVETALLSTVTLFLDRIDKTRIRHLSYCRDERRAYFNFINHVTAPFQTGLLMSFGEVVRHPVRNYYSYAKVGRYS